MPSAKIASTTPARQENGEFRCFTVPLRLAPYGKLGPYPIAIGWPEKVPQSNEIH